jgi:hypothetical protein
VHPRLNALLCVGAALMCLTMILAVDHGSADAAPTTTTSSTSSTTTITNPSTTTQADQRPFNVKLSETVVHLGDALLISGTGCPDVKDASVEAYRRVDGGRVGFIPGNRIRFAPQANGTFEGTMMIQQPLADGLEKLDVLCHPGGPTAELDITGVSPSLPNMTATAGGQLHVTLYRERSSLVEPCSLKPQGNPSSSSRPKGTRVARSRPHS